MKNIFLPSGKFSIFLKILNFLWAFFFPFAFQAEAASRGASLYRYYVSLNLMGSWVTAVGDAITYLPPLPEAVIKPFVYIVSMSSLEKSGERSRSVASHIFLSFLFLILNQKLLTGWESSAPEVKGILLTIYYPQRRAEVGSFHSRNWQINCAEN